MKTENSMGTPRRPWDRRAFLRTCGILGVGAISGGVLQATWNVVRLRPAVLRVVHTRLAMGTYVTMTVIHASRDLAQEAIGRAFGEIDRLVSIFNRHDPATPVSTLNREGTFPDPPQELAVLVRRSLYFHRLSRGAFDITVKPLLDLFEEKRRSATMVFPTPAEIDAVLDRVGADKMEITPAGLRFQRSGMGITLDGIAKGYIVDRASRILTAHGIVQHLINAGGDIRASGARAGERPWTIAIEDPRKRGNYPDIIQITTGAVATSGSYEVYYDKDRIFHHLVDPKTGRSPHQSVSVSVRAKTAMQADALSTAVFVLGPEEGLRIMSGLECSECLVIDKYGRLLRSRGWVHL